MKTLIYSLAGPKKLNRIEAELHYILLGLFRVSLIVNWAIDFALKLFKKIFILPYAIFSHSKMFINNIMNSFTFF